MSSSAALINGQLVVTGDNSNNTITLDHTGASTFVDNFAFPDAAITGGILINSGSGRDFISIRATAKPVSVNGQGGLDFVLVGKAGSVQDIQAPLTVTNSGGSLGVTEIQLDDSADPKARSVTLANAGALATITGLAPGTISYSQSGTRSVFLRAGGGGDTFHIEDTYNNGFQAQTILNGGGGDDTINVRRTTGRLNILGDLGSDTVNVGLNNSVQSIKGELLVRDADGLAALNLNNQADTSGLAVQLNVALDAGSLLGTILDLAPAAIRYRQGEIGTLTVNGGIGGNTFIVNSTMPGTQTVLNTGTGTDTVLVRATGGTLAINGRGGLDTVNVGLDGSAQGIRGELSVTNTGGSGNSTALSLDDSAVSSERNVAIESFLDATTSKFVGRIFGLAPVPVRFAADAIRSLAIASGGGNSFKVNGTPRNATTSLNVGNGNDTVNVLRTDGPLLVNGRGGLDTVNVGLDGSAQGIKGALSVTNTLGGSTALSLDDSIDAGARNVTLAIGAKGTITGLAPATISYDLATVRSLAVRGGTGGNTFNVLNTVLNSIASPTTLDTGTGKDTVNIQGTTGALTVNGQNGRDTVNVGKNNSVRAILGPVTVTNAFSFSALTLNDLADAEERDVLLNIIDVGGVPTGSITGLAPAAIRFREADIASLIINGGSGGNSFFVTDTPLNSGGATTTINTGTGDDEVVVLGTGGALAINGQDGNDLVNVGELDGVRGIGGALSLTNAGGSTALFVNGQPDDVARTAAITTEGNTGFITGLTPAAISFNTSQVNTVTIHAGSGGNTFTIDGTASNATTTLNSGIGIDTVNVLRTAGPLVINGQFGLDTVNVGLANSVRSINGALTVTNVGKSTALRLNNQADGVARNVTLATAGVNGTITGLAPAPITFRQGDVRSLTISSGNGGNTYTVANTLSNFFAGTSTTLNTGRGRDTVNVRGTTGALVVNTGDGDDTVNVGSTGNTLDGIQGALTVNGSAGTDTLNLNDQGSKTPHTYAETPTSLQRSGAATITFSGIEARQLNKGPVASLLAFTDRTVTAAASGGLVTVTGRIVQPDPEATFTLRVDWGDGSCPETFAFPAGSDGRVIEVAHRYAKDGSYPIRLEWFGPQGQGNGWTEMAVVTNATPAPATVEAILVNDGSPQRSSVRSLTVVFSTVVTIDPGAFALHRDGGGSIGLEVSTAVVGGKTVATLTFKGKGVQGGELPDGRYTLKVKARKVRDSSGAALDGDGDGQAGGARSYEFFRLAGDLDGDGRADAPTTLWTSHRS